MTNHEIAVEIVKLATTIINVIEENVTHSVQEQIINITYKRKMTSIPLRLYYDQHTDNFFAHYDESYTYTYNITKVIELFRKMV